MPTRQKTWISAFGFIMLMLTTVAWATPVPDTGQTKCYDVAGAVITCPLPGQALYGQDANYSIDSMSYTKLDGNGIALLDSATSWSMVKDNVTGLIWEMKTNEDGVKNYNDPNDADNTYSWYDSNPATNGGNAGTPSNGTDTEDFIKALNDANYGGYSDWRMPTIKELTYIVNYSIPLGPRINTGYFPNTARWYWSSTTSASDTSYAWGVGFVYGHYYYAGPKDNGGNYYARAVRGGQSGLLGNLVTRSFDSLDSGSIEDATTAADSYTDNGDGTVTDTSTGLMWQQAGSSNVMTWEQALAYCEGLNLGGDTDWRLPTIKELRSIVDHSRYNPAINNTYFPVTAASWYWSSTTDADFTNYARGVGSYRGNDDHGYKLGNNYARAVRGGQSVPLDHPVLLVNPTTQNVTRDAGRTTFSVSNTGTGTMPWTAQVTPASSWISITAGTRGTDSGTVTCAFGDNIDTSARTGTIRVTAAGATGSPVDVTITQAPTTIQPLLSVTPSNRAVSKNFGRTTFSVSNTGTGTMPWTAQVTPASSWISITAGTRGTDSGTITCAFGDNIDTSARTGTIRVTAAGATGSPVDVTVTQAGTPTGVSQPVYRFFNSISDAHFYTINESEKDAGIQNNNWFWYEGIAFYAFPKEQPGGG